MVLLTLARFALVLVYITPQTNTLTSAQGGLTEAHAGMLNEETALRGYLATRDPQYLEPYKIGERQIARGDAALAGGLAAVGSQAESVPVLSAQSAWRSQWAGPAASSRALSPELLASGKRLFDAYRQPQGELAQRLDARLASLGSLAAATLYLSLALGAVLGLLFCALWIAERRRLRSLMVAPVEHLVADLAVLSAGGSIRDIRTEGPEEVRKIAAAIRSAATGLEEAQAAVLENQQRTLQILDSLPLGVSMVDPDGKPVYANERSTQLLGKGIDPNATGDTLAQVYAVYVAGTDMPYDAASMPLLRALGGQPAPVARDLEVRPPGRRIVLEVRASALHDRAGILSGAVAVFDDITAANSRCALGSAE